MVENERLSSSNPGSDRSHENSANAKTEAERSGWLQDKFLSTLNHELRTPLNAVLGFAELLAEERAGPLNERQRRYVSHILHGGQHILRLITDILDYSRIEAGRLPLAVDSVPIQSCIGEVFDLLRPLAERNSQMLLQTGPRDLCVRADATRLKQVLQHLVANAIKFSPEKTKIEVTAAEMGNLARIEVRDSGPGIPTEEQARIFGAFYRMQVPDQSQTGTGLGLAISKRLVEMQGGQLDVQSNPGSGSCFYFTLPLVPPAAPSPSDRGARQIEQKTF
jgi:signal transduction histidine kinase